MTRTPDFDELVGNDLEDGEQARLRAVHDLLVTAGPPPELSPELEAGPDMLITYRHRRGRRTWRRPALLAAALLVLAAVFFGGYISGSTGGSGEEAFQEVREVAMRGTAAAPNARASLAIGEHYGRNWPMHLVASGLPQLSGDEYYVVWLTRKGKIVGPCGGFLVRNGNVRIFLNAPYELHGVGWIVTVQRPDVRRLGKTVLTT